MTIKTPQRIYKTDLTPSEAVQDIVKLEAAKREIDQRLKSLRDMLLEECQNNNVLTLKTDNFTIVRAKRKTLKVTNEQELQEQLKRLGHELVLKLDMAYMKPVVKANLDKLDGVEENETEYIQIRLPKGDK